MSVTDALDAMRSGLPGCLLVAYADLSSKLVLSASAVGHPGQEELDLLSGAAQLALDGLVAEGAAPVWAANAPEAPADVAILMTGTEVRVFLRAQGEAPETLICVCAPDSDLSRVVEVGRNTLGQLQDSAA